MRAVPFFENVKTQLEYSTILITISSEARVAAYRQPSLYFEGMLTVHTSSYAHFN